jgi:hypothetical protein
MAVDGREDPMCHLRKISLLTLVLGLVGTATAVSQTQPTIPEWLAARGRDSTLVINVGSGASPSVDSLLRRTDRIAKGTLGSSRSFLSEDQRQIFTEFQIVSPTILFDRNPPVGSRPGVVEPVTVTQLGGTVTINGLRFTEINETLPLMKEGTTVLVLLEQKAGRFLLVGDFLGAFEIRGNSMTPLVRKEDFAREYRGVALADGERRMLGSIRRP